MHPSRQFSGVKPGLAQELTGFTGTPKMFRSRFRDEVNEGVTKLYSAKQIRDIRMQLLNIPADTKRPLTLPPIINFRMAKGGVGKSTKAGNVASCLALSGYRVLAIDGDPQASLTTLFGIDWTEAEITHIGMLIERQGSDAPVNPEKAVWSIYPDGMLDLIPADISMANDSWMISKMNGVSLFKQLLQKQIAFFSQYDVIVIDSAPGSSLLATSFMVASDIITAVINPEGQSLAALEVLASNVEEINRAFERKKDPLDVLIVVNRYNQSKKPHNVALSKLAAKYPGKVADTVVRDFIGFIREVDPDNLHANGPVFEREPTSAGARDVIDLTKILVRSYGIKLAGVDPLGRASA